MQERRFRGVEQVTTEPGFECPECSAQLYGAGACRHCGWKPASQRPAVPTAPERGPYLAPSPTEVQAFMAEIRSRLGVVPEPVAPPAIPLSDSCGHATREECERDAMNWYRMQAAEVGKRRGRGFRR